MNGAQALLDRAAILIAEDETYIALALQWAVDDAGGTVIGPAATIGEALALIDATHIEGAILDVNLGDEDIAPVLERLVAIGAPIILQTGIGLPPRLAARFPNLIVHIKPYAPENLVEEIAKLLRAKRGQAAILN